MVDEKLDDQVWVTVVATGYGTGHPRRREAERPGIADRNWIEARSPVREPPGEPRVSRGRQREPERAFDLDVPEFIPRR
jgi:cell division protein FtsZ